VRRPTRIRRPNCSLLDRTPRAGCQKTLIETRVSAIEHGAGSSAQGGPAIPGAFATCGLDPGRDQRDPNPAFLQIVSNLWVNFARLDATGANVGDDILLSPASGFRRAVRWPGSLGPRWWSRRTRGRARIATTCTSYA
jgi:hypothetical protein